MDLHDNGPLPTRIQLKGCHYCTTAAGRMPARVYFSRTRLFYFYFFLYLLRGVFTVRAMAVQTWHAPVPAPVHEVCHCKLLSFVPSRPLLAFLLTISMGAELCLPAQWWKKGNQERSPSPYRLLLAFYRFTATPFASLSFPFARAAVTV